MLIENKMENKSKLDLIKKKIVFFDGDGTIWYPKKTKHKEKPHWVYSLSENEGDHSKHLIIVPTVIKTLKRLKKMGVVVVLLSTHPQSPEEANNVIQNRIKYFKLGNLFDEVYATRDFHSSKGEFINNILKKRKIAKSKALMVGDKYRWDYKPARDLGIDALLIETEYNKEDIQSKRIKKTIKQIKDILGYIIN